MIPYADLAGENKTNHNLNWPYIPDHPFRHGTIIRAGITCKKILL